MAKSERLDIILGQQYTNRVHPIVSSLSVHNRSRSNYFDVSPSLPKSVSSDFILTGDVGLRGNETRYDTSTLYTGSVRSSNTDGYPVLNNRSNADGYSVLNDRSSTDGYPVLNDRSPVYEPLDADTRSLLRIQRVLNGSYNELALDPFDEIFPLDNRGNNNNNSVPPITADDDVIEVYDSDDISTHGDDNFLVQKLLPNIPEKEHIYEPIPSISHELIERIDARPCMCNPRTHIEIACAFLLCLLMIAVVVLGLLLRNKALEINEFSKKCHLDSPSNETSHNETTNDISPNKLNAMAFVNRSILLELMHFNSGITGISVLREELFVIRDGSTQVHVFNANRFTFLRNITISESRKSNLSAIVASPRYNSLCICDIGLRVVHLYSTSTNGIRTSWPVDGDCLGLSLTRHENILLTLDLKYAALFQEYTFDGGRFVKEAVVDRSDLGINPWHTVQLSGGRVVVIGCNFFVTSRIVKIVDIAGHTQHYYDELSKDQPNRSSQIAVDGFENVIVADRYNNRVLLLNPSLDLSGEIAIPGELKLERPRALHLDQLNRRLYIGEFSDTGRLFVLGV